MSTTLAELTKELEDCAVIGVSGGTEWKRKIVRRLVDQIVELVRNGQDDRHDPMGNDGAGASHSQ